MRSFLTLFALGILFFTACKKAPYEPPPYKQPFELEGLSNVIYDLNPFNVEPQVGSQQLRVVFLADSPQKVSVQLAGLPAGIEGDLNIFTNAKYVYAPFNAKLTLTYKGAAPGIYAAKILLQPEKDSLREYPFTITVKGQSCNAVFAPKNYFTTENYPALRTYPTTITPSDTSAVFLNFNNILGNGINLTGSIDCQRYRLDLQEKKVGDTTYSGYGNIKYWENSLSEIEVLLFRRAANGWQNVISYTYRPRP